MHTTRRRFFALAGGLTAGAFAPSVTLRRGIERVEAQPIPGSPTFRGSAGTVPLGPIALTAGVTIVRAQFNGTQNFAASLVLPEAGTGPSGPPTSGGFFALFDQIGAFKGAAAALVGTPGDYYLQVDSTAAYQLSVEQPLPETVSAVPQTSFSGKGQDVSSYFILPDGISQISCQTASPFLEVALFHLDDLGGAAIAAGVQGYGATIFDFRDLANQASFPISLPDPGPYVLAAFNDITDQSTWMVAFA